MCSVSRYMCDVLKEKHMVYIQAIIQQQRVWCTPLIILLIRAQK